LYLAHQLAVNNGTTVVPAIPGRIDDLNQDLATEETQPDLWPQQNYE
jgi:hypothetical protein